MKIVLRVGGSVVASPLNPALISKYVALLERLKRQQNQVALVVGGGTYARDFIEASKALGLEENIQDEIAISVSRVLAQLFLKKLGKSGCNDVSLTVEHAAKCLHEARIPVMGGLKPGMTTDSVAALVCEKIGADLLVKATDQDGVYDKDPRKHENAVLLSHLTFDNLPQVFSEDRHKAGIHQIIDPEAVRILKRLHIRVIVLNGFKPGNVLSAVEGKPIGTCIE
jgi:uridylate kinase